MVSPDRKIIRMHSEFGESPPNKCRDCANLLRIEHHDRTYRKCRVYGISNAESTDWKCGYDACGMFNKPYTGPAMMKIFNSRKGLTPDYQCEGQLSFFDESL